MQGNVALLSEGFEREANALRHSIDNFRGIDTTSIEQVVRNFERQVDRMRDIFAMQAENMQRQSDGKSMAYNEKAFLEV